MTAGATLLAAETLKKTPYVPTIDINVLAGPYAAGVDRFGTTDSRAAFQQALNDAAANNIKKVVVPPGVYSIEWVDFNSVNPAITINAYKIGLAIPSGVTLWLEPGAELKAGVAVNNGSVNNYFITNMNFGVGGDVDVWVKGSGTINGNKAAQPATVSTGRGSAAGSAGFIFNGVGFCRVNRGGIWGINIHSVRGGSVASGSETFCAEFFHCANMTAYGCEVWGGSSSANTSSGFSADYSTGLQYAFNKAHDLAVMGFTHFMSAGITHYGDRAWLCGSNGLNSEYDIDVTYSGCISGSQVTIVDDANSPAGFTTGGTTLGNAGSGLTILGGWNGALSKAGGNNIIVEGCILRNNLYGLDLNGCMSVIVTGSDLTESTTRAINTSGAGLLGLRMSKCRTRSVTRPSDDLWFSVTNQQSAAGAHGSGTGSSAVVFKAGTPIVSAATPAFPNTGIPWRNPFGVDVLVTIVTGAGVTWDTTGLGPIALGACRTATDVSISTGGAVVSDMLKLSSVDSGKTVIGTNLTTPTTFSSITDARQGTLVAGASSTVARGGVLTVFDGPVSLGLPAGMAVMQFVIPACGAMWPKYSGGTNTWTITPLFA